MSPPSACGSYAAHPCHTHEDHRDEIGHFSNFFGDLDRCNAKVEETKAAHACDGSPSMLLRIVPPAASMSRRDIPRSSCAEAEALCAPMHRLERCLLAAMLRCTSKAQCHSRRLVSCCAGTPWQLSMLANLPTTSQHNLQYFMLVAPSGLSNDLS